MKMYSLTKIIALTTLVLGGCSPAQGWLHAVESDVGSLAIAVELQPAS